MALSYVPADYVEPILTKMHISYEWCLGLSTTSFATVCVFVATRFGYKAVIQKLQLQNAKAFEAVKNAKDKMQLIETLFEKNIEKQNKIINYLQQLQLTNSAILDMEKQTAKDRLAGGLMANENRAELEKSLQTVLEKEQEVADLKATSVVYEKTVEKVMEVENPQLSENDGLI